MTGYDNILNLLILYDTARGFLPLREAPDVIHHGILSFSGATGTRRVEYLAHDGAGRFTAVPARGTRPARPVSCQVATETLALFRQNPGPLTMAALGPGEPALEEAAERLSLTLIIPVADEYALHGLIGIGDKLFGDIYTDTELSLMHEIASLLTAALYRQIRPTAERLAPGTDASLDAMRREHPPLARIAGRSPAIRVIMEEILTLADFDLPVLITGETGTGKELVARALHEIGPRAAGPFEAVNCAAIPRELVSSHLFGHEKGAFTGAIAEAKGAFERAGEGTLFLDEIGDMPMEVQASLLRVLQERRFSRVGGERSMPARARILSATNQNLEEAVAAGTFRADLFYRIQMYSLRLPPLRERREDIPLLVEHILGDVRRVRGSAPRAGVAFLDALAGQRLRGNVRELEGLVLSAIVRAVGGDTLEAAHLMPELSRPGTSGQIATAAAAGTSQAGETPPPGVIPYEEMEREYVRSVLRVTEGNKKQAAALMGIPRTTLNDRMKKLGLDATS